MALTAGTIDTIADGSMIQPHRERNLTPSEIRKDRLSIPREWVLDRGEH
jgi:hypothetical protein